MSGTLIIIPLFAAAVSAQTLTFEVASVKPSPEKDVARSYSPDSPDSLILRRVTLKLLMATVYDLPVSQVSGGPGWAESEMFDVEAKAAGPATKKEKMQMLGALLADRFQLKFHRQPSIMRAYVLVPSAGGLKIHPSKPEDRAPVGNPGVMALRASMKQLASIIGVYVTWGREPPFPGQGPLTPPEPLPVIDQTGLTGEYDIVLDMTKSRDWFVVLPQQLGLKLEPRKVATEMLIIDNAIKPLPN